MSSEHTNGRVAMLWFLLSAALVAVDQLVKFLVRANIPPYSSIPFIPHVMDLTYVQNTGAAFSLLSGHTWVLTAISAVASVVLAIALARNVLKSRGGSALLAVILAGAVGNLIDRAAFGFVTDMFQTTFVDFAVFNVADICLTCGCAALCVYILFFYGREDKAKEGPHDAPDADG